MDTRIPQPLQIEKRTPLNLIVGSGLPETEIFGCTLCRSIAQASLCSVSNELSRFTMNSVSRMLCCIGMRPALQSPLFLNSPQRYKILAN